MVDTNTSDANKGSAWLPLFSMAMQLTSLAQLRTFTVYVNRQLMESGLLSGMKRELSHPAMIEEARRRVIALLRKRSKTTPETNRRVADLEGEIANLVEAIASGALRSSPALGSRLAAA